MSDGPGDREQVGSIAEEAAKLLGALQGWARDGSADAPGSSGSASAAASGVLHDLNAHLATGGADCRYCPVCQVISAVRETSPEVKHHLTSAATSLLHAATGVLESHAPRQPSREQGEADRRDPVEKIDLADHADDADWED